MKTIKKKRQTEDSKPFKVSRNIRTDRDPDDDRFDEDKPKSKKKPLKKKTKKYDDTELTFEKEKTKLVIDETKVKSKSVKALKRLSKEKSKNDKVEEVADRLVKKVKKNLKEHEPKDDNDFRIVYLDMFEKQRLIIKRTEKRLLSKSKDGKEKSGGREIYQLAQMYSQLRETIADLRSISDLSDHAERIVDLCMRPLFTSIVQKMTNILYSLKVKIKDKVKDKEQVQVFEQIDDLTVEFGKELQEQYDKVAEKIRSMMTEAK